MKKIIRGEYLDVESKLLNDIKEVDIDFEIENEKDSILYYSQNFRRKCINDGFELINIYQIFHFQWEMDEWGAIGIKNGKRYRLETSHGQLIPKLENE